MPTLTQTIDLLEQFAPLALAEEWDNVGLLVGDRKRSVERLMTCLTLTPSTVEEAVRERAGLVVVHHPLPFRPLSRITSDTTVGRLLLQLVEARIAVYSTHTAFDSAREGINQRLAEGLELLEVRPLAASAASDDPSVGTGRIGRTRQAVRLAELADRLKAFLHINEVRAVGDRNATVERVAIGCGSGGTFLETATQQAAQCLVTGEATFHTCLEAEATGMCLLLVGHFASERFALELLAEFLKQKLPDVHVWASACERDPLYLM